MFLWTTENAEAGHMWSAGRYVPTPVLGSFLQGRVAGQFIVRVKLFSKW